MDEQKPMNNLNRLVQLTRWLHILQRHIQVRSQDHAFQLSLLVQAVLRRRQLKQRERQRGMQPNNYATFRKVLLLILITTYE
jgi:hypothetical protein